MHEASKGCDHRSDLVGVTDSNIKLRLNHYTWLTIDRNKRMVLRNIQLPEASENEVHREAANLWGSFSRVKIILQDSDSIWFLAKNLGANGLTQPWHFCKVKM